MEQIVVVADKELEGHGRILCHLLCKHGNIMATLWNIKNFKDNEHNTTANNRFIFLGDVEPIKLMVDSIDKDNDNWIIDQGVRIGFDYHRAFIQQIDKPTNIDLLNESVKNFFKSFFIITLIIQPTNPLNIFKLVSEYTKLKKNKKDLMISQYTNAIKIFMEKTLERFLEK